MPFDDVALETWCRSLLADGRVSSVGTRVHPASETDAFEWMGGEGASADPTFDLASLTKPLAATLALVLHQSGELGLDTRLGELWRGAEPRIARLSLESLLRHQAGLYRWMPLYAACRDRDEVAQRLLAGEWLEGAAAGTGGETYSDLDYILWTLSVERALDTSFYDLLLRHVAVPLGVERGFAESRPGGDLSSDRMVECRLTTGREVDLARERGLEIDELPAPRRGEAQDGNCRFLRRAGGHAGVFASVSALSAVVREWTSPDRLLSRESVARALGGHGRFAMGWFRDQQTAAGRRLGPGAFGHDGFTGGTVWVDPDSGMSTVVLCHRTSLEVDLSEARATLVAAISNGESAGPERPA